jgi:hypothetical protein
MMMPAIQFLKRNALVILTVFTSIFFIVFFSNNFFGKNTMANKKPHFDGEVFSLAEPPVIEPLKINFQDDNTVPPPGWLKDIGEPFGPHPGIYQGAPLVYGWA